MDVKPAAAGPAVNRNDPGQADLTQEDPLVQPDNTRTRNTLRRERHRTARLMQRIPNECGLALAAPRPMMSSTNTDPTNPPNPNEFLSQPPGGGHAPRTPAIHQRQRTGRRPTRTYLSA